MPKLLKVTLSLPRMVTITLSTDDASAKLNVADVAELICDALTVNACEALVDVLVNEISPHADWVAEMPPAAHRALAVALSWAASAVKLRPVASSTSSTISGLPLAKPGSEITLAELSATSEPHCTPAC
jgi:hypothetical protein